MRIELAIYTAIAGYDWQPTPHFSREELNQIKMKIGRFPNIQMDEVPYGGLFIEGAFLVCYRFHIRSHGDVHGRDALYCVVGRVPLTAVPRLDLAALFNAPALAAPAAQPFPTEVDVAELPVANPPTLSLQQVGALAAACTRSTFACKLHAPSAVTLMEADALKTEPPVPKPSPDQKPATPFPCPCTQEESILSSSVSPTLVSPRSPSSTRVPPTTRTEIHAYETTPKTSPSIPPTLLELTSSDHAVPWKKPLISPLYHLFWSIVLFSLGVIILLCWLFLKDFCNAKSTAKIENTIPAGQTQESVEEPVPPAAPTLDKTQPSALPRAEMGVSTATTPKAVKAD